MLVTYKSDYLEESQINLWGTVFVDKRCHVVFCCDDMKSSWGNRDIGFRAFHMGRNPQDNDSPKLVHLYFASLVIPRYIQRSSTTAPSAGKLLSVRGLNNASRDAI